jgi:hypothetical protein
MDALIKELNRRHKKTVSKFSPDFLFELCSYMELLVWDTTAQEILKGQKQEQEAGTHDPTNIWLSYFKLYNRVYEPLKILKVDPNKHFSHFYSLKETDRESPFFLFMFANPLFVKAFWQRLKYRNWLDDLHGQIVTLLKDKELLPNRTAYRTTPLASALGITPQSLWQDITIKFKTPGTNLEIFYKDKSYSTNHEDLGFVSKLNGIKPKLYWTFLRAMALNKEAGVFPLANFNRAEREQHNKTKYFLANHLKQLFGIETDPFEPYDKDKQAYKIKIKLVPEREFQDDWWSRNIYTEQDNFG